MAAVSTTIRLLTEPTERSTGWQAKAECRRPEYPEDLWFPTGTAGPALEQAAQAKAVCLSCPVLATCRSWALDVLEYGVAGGLDEEERRAVRRARAASRAEVSA